MKILFIAPTLPINTGSGGSIRSFQLYHELSSFAEIDILTASSANELPPEMLHATHQFNYLGHAVIPWRRSLYYRKVDLHNVLKEIMHKNEYDYVFIRYYDTAYRLGTINMANLILDCDDCFLEIADQFFLGAYGPITSNFLIKKCRIYLLRLFKPAIWHVLKSEYVKNLAKVKKVIYSRKSQFISWDKNFLLIPNKTINNERNPAEPNNTTAVNVLFVGVLDYPPNINGLDNFIENVWPHIINHIPDASLKIVGKGLPSVLHKKWSLHKNVRICGYVSDINDVYSDVDISIVPISQGSGTHIKIMESLMYGKPVVLSQFAHRGYESTLLDGDSLSVAQNNNEFAQKVIELINNPSLRKMMATRGQSQVIRHHMVNKEKSLLRELLTLNTPSSTY